MRSCNDWTITGWVYLFHYMTCLHVILVTMWPGTADMVKSNWMWKVQSFNENWMLLQCGSCFSFFGMYLIFLQRFVSLGRFICESLLSCSCIQSSITAFTHVSLLYWESKALLLFGEVGLPSSLDMVLKVGADSVSTSTSNRFTPISWSAATGAWFFFSAVLLQKHLQMLHFALLKPLKSGFKHGRTLQKAWLMASLKYMHQKAF